MPKFAEIKILPVILVPSLNSTIVDLILTVLNQIAMVDYQSGPDLNGMYILNLELLRPFSFTTTYYTITHNYLITVLTGIKGFSYQVQNFFIVRLVFSLHILCKNLNAI